MAVNGGHAGTKKGPNWGHVKLLCSALPPLKVQDLFGRSCFVAILLGLLCRRLCFRACTIVLVLLILDFDNVCLFLVCLLGIVLDSLFWIGFLLVDGANTCLLDKLFAEFSELRCLAGSFGLFVEP